MGLPLGCAEIGAILFGQEMSYNPADPKWINRDRFILSAGHGSMFLYSWLHIAGYDLSIKEVENFRAKDSKTPGHPEYDFTPGVECTTGPLGQGVGNGVGMAAAAKLAGATLNTAEHTQSEDVQMRFEAQGWEVLTVDGHDMDAVTKAYRYAKDSDNGKPTLIVCKTIIGKGIDEIAGTCAAHGEAGVAYQDSGRESLGLPADKKWFVSDETYSYFKGHGEKLAKAYDAWGETFAAWKAANPDKAAALQDAIDMKVPSDLLSKMPEFTPGAQIATRQAGADVLQPVAEAMPFFNSGSADLHGSNKNYIKGVGDFSKSNYGGRNFYYGIREHGMGAILNGMGFYGLFRPSGSTFLVFSGYMMGSVRVAALSHLPVVYIWTHDSIGVGEDGPTHQPVEVVAGLRAMPNLDVQRPGDAEETAASYVSAMERTDGPTALILSRQNLPVLECASAAAKREGALKGGYTLIKEEGELETILLATGSELHLAVEAAEKLGKGTRFVSMPCVEAFERQSDEYKASVLSDKSKTVAVEAGVTPAWYKYADKVLGVDYFGESAPAPLIFEAKGMTTDGLVALAKA